MKKTIFFALATLLVFFISIHPVKADDNTPGEVLQQLKELKETQKQILGSLEEIKSELQIVKVRVSSS